MAIFSSVIAASCVAASIQLGPTVPEVLSVRPALVPDRTILLTVRGMPIYEYEVQEAVQQNVEELRTLSSAELASAKQALYKRELRRIIERELIIDEMLARVVAFNPRAVTLKVLEECEKSANERMKQIRVTLRLANDHDLDLYLNDRGITREGLMRHLMRGALLNVFFAEILKEKAKTIQWEDLQEYYDQHPQEFLEVPCVKWSQRFVPANAFQSRDRAQRYAEDMVKRFAKSPGLNLEKKADDLMWKLEPRELDEVLTDSDSIDAASSLPVIRRLLTSLEEGEVGMTQGTSGYHVVRMITKRSANQRKPLSDETVQAQIRKKLESEMASALYKDLTKRLVVRALFLEALTGGRQKSSMAAMLAQMDPTSVEPKTEEALVDAKTGAEMAHLTSMSARREVLTVAPRVVDE